jgi:hypothetical protein
MVVVDTPPNSSRDAKVGPKVTYPLKEKDVFVIKF